jgi:hypothetical protein
MRTSGDHRFIPALILLLAGGGWIGAPTPAGAQQADPADVSSVDGIIAAVYDVISGPAGQARDWDRWRTLFVDGARLIPVARAQDGSSRARIMTPEDYVGGAGPMLERDGFFEVEIGRVQESFGQITHLFSSYESRRSPSDPAPFARGINSFQLFNDGTRWWVVSIMWDSERPGNPIPRRYIGR